MPQNLDENTRQVIVGVTGLALTILGSANAAAQGIVLPRLQKKLGTTKWTGPPLLRGCVGAVLVMLTLSAVLTVPIIALGGGRGGNHNESTDSAASSSSSSLPLDSADALTSSINFCEDDFVDSNWIAEPANTASNLASYWPLALWGLFGKPSQEWRTRAAGHKRFGVAYATLLAIGIGSTLLHALLTAGAQGGDELPMLWFVASLSFMALDVILQGSRMNLSVIVSTVVFGYDASQAQKQDRWLLHWLVGGSAVVATCIYCFSRENFLPFYIMFVLYSKIATFGLMASSFILKWNGNIQFRAQVLLPLVVCSAWMAIFAIMAWVSEMLYCASAQDSEFGPFVKFLSNRVVHPFWHCSSALLAWLLIQALLAGQGLQRGWGEPSLQCASWWAGGVPYVTFSKGPTSPTSLHVSTTRRLSRNGTTFVSSTTFTTASSMAAAVSSSSSTTHKGTDSPSSASTASLSFDGKES